MWAGDLFLLKVLVTIRSVATGKQLPLGQCVIPSENNEFS